MTANEALRSVARDLLRGLEYDHENWFSCNCGLVAKKLGEARIAKSFSSICGNVGLRDYSNLANHCPLTGLPDWHVIGILERAGLSRKDIADLEYFGNAEVRERAGVNQEQYDERDAVAKYMLSLADWREEREQPSDEEITTALCNAVDGGEMDELIDAAELVEA